MASNGLTFREWYRILRQHNHFSIWQALTFALWLASPHTIKGVHRPLVARVFEHFHGEVR